MLYGLVSKFHEMFIFLFKLLDSEIIELLFHAFIGFELISEFVVFSLVLNLGFEFFSGILNVIRYIIFHFVEVLPKVYSVDATKIIVKVLMYVPHSQLGIKFLNMVSRAHC